MIEVKKFIDFLKKKGIVFFSGVPDSILKDFCNYLDRNEVKKKHVITSNEGTALSLAAGYHLATNKVPLVYLQNSGFGNLLNPTLSLMDEKVYSIPAIILMGWRGEPGKKDEPQHLTQGSVTQKLIKIIKKDCYVLKGNELYDFKEIEKKLKIVKKKNKPIFILVKKNILINKSTKKNINQSKKSNMFRENVISILINNLKGNFRFVSSTGMISRELYELRKIKKDKICKDFLTVGSMGHASQIASGIALNSNKKIVCIDGDGSILMHLGGLATIGNLKLKNFIHIALNNGTHESVGGQKTTAPNLSLSNIAKACGYKNVFNRVNTENKLIKKLKTVKKLDGPIFIECLIKTGHRKKLGRPKEKPIQNKKKFMQSL